MKLQNMKKWLMEGSNAAVQPNNIINHCEAEVSNVTSEISSKIKRLSRHFQLQQNVRYVGARQLDKLAKWVWPIPQY